MSRGTLWLSRNAPQGRTALDGSEATYSSRLACSGSSSGCSSQPSRNKGRTLSTKGCRRWVGRRVLVEKRSRGARIDLQQGSAGRTRGLANARKRCRSLSGWLPDPTSVWTRRYRVLRIGRPTRSKLEFHDTYGLAVHQTLRGLPKDGLARQIPLKSRIPNRSIRARTGRCAKAPEYDSEAVGFSAQRHAGMNSHRNETRRPNARSRKIHWGRCK